MMQSTTRVEMKKVEAAEILGRMVEQETHYLAADYIHNNYQNYDLQNANTRHCITQSPISVADLDRGNGVVASATSATAISSNDSTSAASSSIRTAPFVEGWRGKICKWMCKVVDSYSMEREIMTISMMYFDRYMSIRRCASTKDQTKFQLVALSSLYLAIKLNETRNMSMENILQLSNGRFCENDLVAMELELMATLDWYLHPKTPQSFVHYLVLLMPNFATGTRKRARDEDEDMTTSMAMDTGMAMNTTMGTQVSSQTTVSCNEIKNMLFNVSNYIVELTAFESRLMMQKPSVVATAAILLSTMGLKEELTSTYDEEEFGHVFEQFIDFEEVYSVMKILHSMIEEFDLSVQSIQKLFDPDGTFYDFSVVYDNSESS